MISPFVDIDWLCVHRDEVVLVDSRWYVDGRSGGDAYAAGHVPGAVFVDLESALSGHGDPAVAGRHPLPDPEDFAAAMSALGIGDEDTVVAYDDAGGVMAARLVWMLRATGHEAALLDGGIGAWPGELEAGASVAGGPEGAVDLEVGSDIAVDLPSGPDPAVDLRSGERTEGRPHAGDRAKGRPHDEGGDRTKGRPPDEDGDRDRAEGRPHDDGGDRTKGRPRDDDGGRGRAKGRPHGGDGDCTEGRPRHEDGDRAKGRPLGGRGTAVFTARPWPAEGLATIEETGALAAAGGTVIDARPGERFAGAPDDLDPRAGHIPGARSVPCRENVDSAGRLLPVAELRERFAIDDAADVISYCGSGVTACHNLLAMEQAGLGTGRLFPGSWSQWSRDPERPVQTVAE